MKHGADTNPKMAIQEGNDVTHRAEMRCDACAYANKVDDLNYQCRRAAPALSAQRGVGRWPYVEPTHWCGDYWPRDVIVRKQFW